MGSGTIGSEVMWELAIEAVTLLYQRSKSDLGILGSLVHNIIRGSDSGDKEQGRRGFCAMNKSTLQ